MTNSNNGVFKENPLRSIIKSVVYRIISFFGTGILILFITNNFQRTILITIVIQIFLIIIYYLHERVWNRINWGRELN